jgi:hypothetical protein
MPDLISSEQYEFELEYPPWSNHTISIWKSLFSKWYDTISFNV